MSCAGDTPRTVLTRWFQRGGVPLAIFRNTIWLAVGVGTSSLADFSIAVYVTRTLGAAEFGRFAFAFAFASLFSALLDFGLSTAVTRELARDRTNASNFADVLALKLFLGLVVFPLIAGASLLVTMDPTLRLLILALGGYLFLIETLNIFYASFRARQRMEVEAAFRLIYAAALVSTVLFGLRLRATVVTLSVAYIMAAAVTVVVVVCVVIAHPHLRLPLRPVVRPEVLRTFANIGVSLTLVRLVSDLMAYADSVILGALGFLEQTGWYYAAVKVNGLVLYPMGLVATAIFPALVSLQRESADRFQNYWDAWAKGTVAFAVLACATVLALGDAIVSALYSPSFLPAGLALRILIFKAAILYAYNLYYHVLIIFNQQRRLFLGVLCGTVVNLSLNALLVPRFGLYGAAVAAVAAHLVILVQYLVFSRKYTTLQLLSQGLRIAASRALVAGVLAYVAMVTVERAGATLLIALLVGGAVYLGSVFVLLRQAPRGIPNDSRR